MTTSYPDLARRLGELKVPCEVARQTLSTPSSVPGDHRYCQDCRGTGRRYMLPNYVRQLCSLSHVLILHGIDGQTKREYVTCAVAGCSVVSPSTNNMDWWEAWEMLAPGRTIAVKMLPDGRMEGSVALGGVYEGDTDIDVLAQAIADLPEVKEAMERADAAS